MNNSIRMNHFLQRMLKKSDDESDGEKINLDSEKLKAEYFPHKTTEWMKNLGTSSPGRSEPTPITRTPTRPSALLRTGTYSNDFRRKNMLVLPEISADSKESPNIDKIRREFEMGFLSPTKRELAEISSKPGRFVKKIVAAFEEKYKAHNEAKVEMKEFPKEYDSSDESSFDEDTTMANIMEDTMTMLSETCVIESLESRLSRYLNSYIATSTVREEESESLGEIETSLELSKNSSTNEEEKCSPILGNKTPSVQTISTDTKMPRKSASVECSPTISPAKLIRRDSSIRRERQPKIVGAYLKKPIEVEDTSIDWIPITGKKLPRKKSFKRLLSILTGKRTTAKSSKLYCSEINLQEETTRELLQDSGYDEKSGSSSSLTSLVSINDLLMQQKYHDSGIIVDERRVYNMTTFGQTSQTASVVRDESDRDFRDDDLSSINDDDTWSASSKKLLLEEVSRSELRLSLGPSFPSAPKAKVVCSLDRREAKWSSGKAAKDNYTGIDEMSGLAPTLPKHTLVSPRKQCLDMSDDSYITPEKTSSPLDMSFSEFDKVQLRRDFQSWTFPTEEYDTPKKFFSKSEPGLATFARKELNRIDKSTTENVYDVPKVKLSRRPRSSIYDDALSLKRRNDNFTLYPAQTPSNEFYGFPCNREPHYATIKPRNARINASREFLRSVGDLNCNDTKYTDNYYGCINAGLEI